METKMLTWDYDGYKNYPQPIDEEIRNAWVNTLITKINQAGAILYQDSYSGAAEHNGVASCNNILAHISLKFLMNRLSYYDKSTMMLSGRFHVTYSDELEIDTIKLYNNFGEIIIQVVNG